MSKAPVWPSQTSRRGANLSSRGAQAQLQPRRVGLARFHFAGTRLDAGDAERQVFWIWLVGRGVEAKGHGRRLAPDRCPTDAATWPSAPSGGSGRCGRALPRSRCSWSRSRLGRVLRRRLRRRSRGRRRPARGAAVARRRSRRRSQSGRRRERRRRRRAARRRASPRSLNPRHMSWRAAVVLLAHRDDVLLAGADGFERGVLGDGRGGHHRVLVNLEHAAEEVGGRGGPGDAPAGHGVRLGETAQGDRALLHAGQRGDRGVLEAAVDEAVVDLVGDHDQIVAAGDVGEGFQRRALEHRAGGVRGIGDQQRFGLGGDRGFDRLLDRARSPARPWS